LAIRLLILRFRRKLEKMLLCHSFLERRALFFTFIQKMNHEDARLRRVHFRDNYEVFKDLGAEVVGVSSQDVESHKSFASHHNLPFILLSDVDNKVRKLYGVPSTLGLLSGRVTYVIDKEGVVKYIFSSQFQPEKHIEEAMRVLKSLAADSATAKF